MSVHPYIFLTNNTRDAMTRYQEILGGTLEVLGVDDMPKDDADQMPFEAPEGFVMHAALMLGDGDLIMASDDPTGDGQGASGMAINITLDDHDEARRIFDAFADGGEIEMPMGETFWSPLFGTCKDRFGVSWMVNVEQAEEA